jgi:hypothetical protein
MLHRCLAPSLPPLDLLWQHRFWNARKSFPLWKFSRWNSSENIPFFRFDVLASCSLLTVRVADPHLKASLPQTPRSYTLYQL